MANHCSNYISIYGRDVEKVSELFQEGIIYSYDDFKTMAQISEEELKDFGTKWFEISYKDFDNEVLILSGDSAWSPPIGLFENLSSLYNVNITMQYEEGGCDFGGITSIKDGVIVEEHILSFYAYQLVYGNGLSMFLDNIEYFDWDSMEDFYKVYGEDTEFIEALSKEDLENIEETIKNSK